jgi:hypothetical protein
LRITVSVGIKRLIAYDDSNVIIDQVNNMCDIKKDTMDAYYAEVRKLEAHFNGPEFHHICLDNNVVTDVLSKLGSKCTLVPVYVFVQDLSKPSIKLFSDPKLLPGIASPQVSRDVLMTEAEDDGCLDFIAYILEHWVPD